MPAWQLYLFYALFAAGLVVTLWLLRLAWQVASSFFGQGDVVEATVREEWAGLVERAPLRLARRLDFPASSHRTYEGTLDGCRVSLQLMLGNKKGLDVSRTEIAVVPPAPGLARIGLRASGERGRDPGGLRFEEVFQVSGADPTAVRSRLGPTAERLVAFVTRRGGSLVVDDAGVRWTTRDTAFGGEGEAVVRELIAIGRETSDRLGRGSSAPAGAGATGRDGERTGGGR